jgi:hypothetical protein
LPAFHERHDILRARGNLSQKQNLAIANRRWAGRLTVSDKDGDDISLKEGDMISVEAFLRRARCQKDGDFHLEISVTDKKGAHCLIVEVPDPEEIGDDTLKERVVQVRQVLDSLGQDIFSATAASVPVKVTGQFSSTRITLALAIPAAIAERITVLPMCGKSIR